MIRFLKYFLYVSIVLFLLLQIYTMTTYKLATNYYEYISDDFISYELLDSDFIDSIQVINHSTLHVFLKKDINYDNFNLIPEKNPFSIHNIDYSLIAEINNSKSKPLVTFYNNNNENNDAIANLALGFLSIFIIGILWSIIDILRSSFVKGIDKLIWLLLTIFIPIIGMYLYVFIGVKQKEKGEY